MRIPSWLGSRRAHAAFGLVLLLQSPARGESLLERAAAALSRGDAVRAEALYRQAIEQSPDSVQGHRGLARATAAVGHPLQAASILLWLGERLIRVALYSEAVEALEEGVSLVPDSAQAHALLGRALMLHGKRLTEAQQHLVRATELGQADVRTVLYLAAANWELGRLAEAEALYRQAGEASHGHSLPLHQLGRLLAAMGRSAEALEVLARAADRSPNDGDLQLDYAQALDAMGEEERALDAYRKAVALDPARKHPHYGLARLLARTGDQQGAQEEFEIYRRLTVEEHDRVRALELARVQIRKGWGLLHNGDPQAAAELFRSLPENDESLLGLAAAYTAIGDQQAAVRALEQAVTLSPQRPDLHLRLIDARLAAGVGIGE